MGYYLIKIFILTLAWVLVHSDNQFFILKSPEGNNKALLVAEYVREEGKLAILCEYIADNWTIREVLRESLDDTTVSTVSRTEMEKLLEMCTKIAVVEDSQNIQEDSNDNSIESVKRGKRRHTSEENMNSAAAANEAEAITPGYSDWPIIFPGTKWCGNGDIAEHYDDLGVHQDTDRCCRAHDLCNDTLPAGETRNKLTNTSPFTKLSCQCDDDFYNCLDRINSVTSNTIGNMYFNILKRECFMEDYPLKYPKKCKKYRTISSRFLKITCKEWEKNTKGPKVMQWIPAKQYKKIPIPGPLTITLPGWVP